MACQQISLTTVHIVRMAAATQAYMPYIASCVMKGPTSSCWLQPASHSAHHSHLSDFELAAHRNMDVTAARQVVFSCGHKFRTSRIVVLAKRRGVVQYVQHLV